jgi:hypothetical protein
MRLSILICQEFIKGQFQNESEQESEKIHVELLKYLRP